jgi:lipopolysaccharide transport system ATP-binding protein
MPEARIIFDRVSKKFRRGEAHDSLRDLIPAIGARLFGASRSHEPNAREFWALKDVSFEVRPGETLGIIGRNGAGKSTTLKILTRILKPTLGRSEVHGRVGALIELTAGFHPDLTGRENVFLQGAIMGMRRQLIARRFDEIVDFAGVAEFIDTPVKRYSSGMQARLGFSVAAHLDPDVLLIDEVLAVGDLAFQQKCYARLQDFRQSGIAIAFVSHNMQAISMLCDRVLYLRPQVPAEIGSVSEMVSAYLTTDAKGADSRVTVVGAQVRANGAVLGEPVCPGTKLTVSVTLQSHSKLPRSGFGLVIHRADGLMIFGGDSMADSVPSVDIEAGDVFTFDVTFKVNMLRGTYTVSGRLLEESRLWPNVELGILGSFVVEETRRWGGVTEVEPRYTIGKGPSHRASVMTEMQETHATATSGR